MTNPIYENVTLLLVIFVWHCDLVGEFPNKKVVAFCAGSVSGLVLHAN